MISVNAHASKGTREHLLEVNGSVFEIRHWNVIAAAVVHAIAAVQTETTSKVGELVSPLLVATAFSVARDQDVEQVGPNRLVVDRVTALSHSCFVLDFGTRDVHMHPQVVHRLLG